MPAHFYGRHAELATLHSWIGQEQSRLVALLGMSGQGKTALAATFIQEIMNGQGLLDGPDEIADASTPAHGFTQIIWRAVRETSSCIEMLQDWLRQLSGEPDAALPANFDLLITRLFAQLREQRCLLVLDGVEAIFETVADGERQDAAADNAVQEAYNTLFRLFFQRRHRGCLLLTSRIRPDALTHLDERNGDYRLLVLPGLTVDDGTTLLTAHGITGTLATPEQLHQRYAGNPLLLRRAANLIYNFFGGDIASFLDEESFFLGDIGAAPAQQLARLSLIQRQVIQTLARANEPLDRQTLWANLQQIQATDAGTNTALTKQQYFHTLQTLHCTFLIQWDGTQIKLPDMLAAYLAEHDLNEHNR